MEEDTQSAGRGNCLPLAPPPTFESSKNSAGANVDTGNGNEVGGGTGTSPHQQRKTLSNIPSPHGCGSLSSPSTSLGCVTFGIADGVLARIGSRRPPALREVRVNEDENGSGEEDEDGNGKEDEADDHVDTDMLGDVRASNHDVPRRRVFVDGAG